MSAAWICAVPGCGRSVPYTDWPRCEQHNVDPPAQIDCARPLNPIEDDEGTTYTGCVLARGHAGECSAGAETVSP